MSNVKTRIGDEFGLSEKELARLYGVEPDALDEHLDSLEEGEKAIYDRIITDIDAVRVGYRQIRMNNDQIDTLRTLLKDYIFHPLVSVIRENGEIGWRLSGDDAQFVAFRASDIAGIDFEWSDVLRLRLHRVVIWPAEDAPEFDQTFRDRVVDITIYLAELTGVL